MKHIRILLLLSLIFSCDYFEKKKVSSEEILEDSLKTFNWNEVDEYPFFVSCDSTTSVTERRACFEMTIRDSIGSHLSDFNFIVDSRIQDTVMITLGISQTGEIQVDSLEINPILQVKMSELDSLLMSSFNNLPELIPAIKRGQPVNTQFKMPVVIQTN